MSNTWKSWEGQIVDAEFPLLRYLGGSESSAVFLTERNENGRLVNAAIRLIPAAPENGQIQLSRWRQASELSHPHLIPLYEMGHSQIGDVAFVYAVMECAEENLAQVLPGRALTAAEAKDMLASVLNVLSYLHDKGFVHGAIKPANIMASGEQLKVSSDALHPVGEALDGRVNFDAYCAPENGNGSFPMTQPLSPASDVWSLGMTLVETLTQNVPVARTAKHQEPFIPPTLAEPFLDIASHCLQRNPHSRWTIEQLAARLEGRAPVPQVQIDEPEPEVAQPLPKPLVRPSGLPAKRHRYAVAFAIALALVVVASLTVPGLLRQNSAPTQVTTAADSPPVAASAPTEPAPSTQARQIKPSSPTLAEEGPRSKAPVAVPALAHPETRREEATNTVARSAVEPPTQGGVAHRVLPEVLQSATNSIRGTVRVRVKVNVDRAGNVEDAELASRGPSKYFSRAALQAAQLWKFNPPKVGGRGVLSTWILQFEFSRGQTNVVPTQEMP